jgi:hypothetical protein
MRPRLITYHIESEDGVLVRGVLATGVFPSASGSDGMLSICVMVCVTGSSAIDNNVGCRPALGAGGEGPLRIK